MPVCRPKNRHNRGLLIAALKERICADGHTLAQDMLFVDEGVSGATLVRPALERLRDIAASGVPEKLYVLAPDRLARKYAHQMLLMEELVACGLEVVFLNHTVGSSPEETMLLQMQGMIAEYERAKIMERNRRGKLHGAKHGNVGVLSGAPYGYRYIRKQIDGTPAQYIVELTQAAIVRQIFNLIGVERLSIGAVVRRLAEDGVLSPTGKPRWDRSVIWGMLQNPAYMGYAAFGKTKSTPPKSGVRPNRHSAEVLKKGCSTKRTDPKEQIRIPVPPIVSESVFQAVQEQLEENRKVARQRKRGAAYLLQGLTVCGHCRYAYYGKKVSKSSSKGKPPYAYYRCIGTDAYRFGGKAICDNKQVRTEHLDDMVWEQVTTLLANPGRLKEEYNRRLEQVDNNKQQDADSARLKKQKRQLEEGKSRLIDSYTDGLITKSEFESKIRQLKTRKEQVSLQLQEVEQHQAGQMELLLLIDRLDEFSEAVNNELHSGDFNTRREIIRALVKRVEIYKNEIVVVFRVTPEPDKVNQSEQTRTGKIMQDCNRRIVSSTG